MFIKNSKIKLNINKKLNKKNYTYKELKKGINKKIIKQISKIRNEPNWMLKIRLKAYKIWNKTKEPRWFNGKYKKINYQKYKYYSHIKLNNKQKKNILKNLNILKKNIGIDTILNSVSINTSYENKLLKLGIIFCSFNKALKKYPSLVKKYMFRVVPIDDNFFSILNTCVFSDGTFIYIPKNVKCPIDLSSYFRINTPNLGQFERTLIILENKTYLNYIEGCTAIIKKKKQLHSAVVEIILKKKSFIKYCTIQNWYVNKKNNKGVLNFVTKRALCLGYKSKINWIQLEKGSAINWKYPSTILLGNKSISNYYSISITKNKQQSDTGNKVIHIGNKTKSLIISKNILSNYSKNTNRNLIIIKKNSNKSVNFTKCDSLLLSNKCKFYTFPKIKVKNGNSIIEHEASSNYIKKSQLYFLLQRGIKKNNAISMIINGFCKNILNMLPLEFYLEAKEILFIDL